MSSAPAHQQSNAADWSIGEIVASRCTKYRRAIEEKEGTMSSADKGKLSLQICFQLDDFNLSAFATDRN